jgi:hypothetical protein
MKIESTAYTVADLESFLDDQLDHERTLLAGRLEQASARLAKLGPRIKPGGGEDAWSEHEVLAHIAVLSKFYGVLVHKVAGGQLTEVDLLSNTNLRDVAGEKMAAIDPSELLRMTLADHARTAKELRILEPASLRRKVNVVGGGYYSEVSAEFLARYPLINHLEEHVDQLERSLA